MKTIKCKFSDNKMLIFFTTVMNPNHCYGEGLIGGSIGLFRINLVREMTKNILSKEYHQKKSLEVYDRIQSGKIKVKREIPYFHPTIINGIWTFSEDQIRFMYEISFCAICMGDITNNNSYFSDLFLSKTQHLYENEYPFIEKFIDDVETIPILFNDGILTI